MEHVPELQRAQRVLAPREIQRPWPTGSIPQKYDPDRWLEAAARAGFKYTAFVTRHHDGYAMWPSNYGAFGTKQKMKGRDLVGQFVGACRKHGIRVGFYFSPTDWNFCPKEWPYPSWPRREPKFLYADPPRSAGLPRFVDMKPEDHEKYFPIFYEYMKGQITELLTRYGKIDLWWWDGLDWPRRLRHPRPGSWTTCCANCSPRWW